MPCDDCSRTESCPPCPNDGEPKSFPVECPQGNGSHCRDHGPYCCHCGIRLQGEPEEPKPEPAPGDAAKVLHKWRRCGQCRHPEHSMLCSVCRCAALTPVVDIAATCRDAGGCPEHPSEEPEPPLTPEEEEQAPCPHESWEVGSQWLDKETGKWWKTRRCADCREHLDNILDDERHDFEGSVEPPQPVRRPPYAVAYSVSGHLYEVALPGDATVRAVDGALVIQHHLGPVAGIVQVLPVINEEKP